MPQPTRFATIDELEEETREELVESRRDSWWTRLRRAVARLGRRIINRLDRRRARRNSRG